MATKNKQHSDEQEQPTGTTKTIQHSEATVFAGKTRLAAIAAIAEPFPVVAQAYAQQSASYLEECEAASDGGVKDAKSVTTSKRWVEAAQAAANSDNH